MPSIIRQSDLMAGEKYMIRLLQTINKLGFLQILKLFLVKKTWQL